MKYDEAYAIYKRLTECNSKTNTDWNELYNDFIEAAVDYARMRVNWLLLDEKLRLDIDKSRTARHDAFIASFNSIALYAANHYDITDIPAAEMNRKDAGDLACYIHCFLGIAAR